MRGKQRAYPRTKPPGILLVEFTNYLGRVRDISPKGAFIEDEHRFSSGEKVSFHLWLDIIDPIPIGATIRRVEDEQGIGVEFDLLQEIHYNRLCEYCGVAPHWSL